jgi:hypothetical protein
MFIYLQINSYILQLKSIRAKTTSGSICKKLPSEGYITGHVPDIGGDLYDDE